MAVRQYVGARYVPKFKEPDINWEADMSYEAMTIVTYNNDSYTSKVPVPANIGTPPNNPDYWVLTGNFNGQLADYAKKTAQAVEDAEQAKKDASEAKSEVGTVQTNLDNEITARQAADKELSEKIDKLSSGTYNVATSLGMDNTGTVDISDILYALGSDTNVGFSEGNYKVGKSGTVNCQCVFVNGAMLTIGDDVTLTFSNGSSIDAGRYQIFNGGSVTGSGIIGKPEWFGCTTNDNTFDCSVAINKALTAFKHVTLGKHIYYVAATIYLDESDKCLTGTGYNDPNNNYDSTIKDTRTSGVTIRIGKTNAVTEHKDFSFGNNLKYLIVDRSNDSGASYGVYLSYTHHAVLSYVRVKNSQYGIYYSFTITSTFEHCSVQQYDTTRDHYAFCTGTGVAPGVIGNNASTYIEDCLALGAINTAHASVGLMLSDAPADTFIDGFETTGYYTGIEISDANTHTPTSSLDVTINRAVIDGCGVGIYVHDTGDLGSVNVSNSYVSIGNYADGVAYNNKNITNGISYVSNKAVMIGAPATAIAFNFDAVIGGLCNGNEILQAYIPYNVKGGYGFIFTDIVKANGLTPTKAVYNLSNVSGVYCGCAIYSPAACYTNLLISDTKSQTELHVTTSNAFARSGDLASVAGVSYNAIGDYTSFVISGTL